MSIECPACKVERDLESYSLTKNPTAGSVCDFCQEAGVKPPEPPQEPKKRGRKPKTPPDPIRPVERPPEAPKTVDKLPSDAAEEAYSAPAFDAQAAEANPAKELAARELCRRRLMPFIQRFRPKYMPGWVHKDICRRLERFVEKVEAGEEPRLLLMMPPRGGKQLADETLVPTPSGWRRHGELKPGDEVFHPSGRPVRVLAVSEKTPSTVKVTFSDGASYFCHENHEWSFFNRMRKEWQTIETNHFLKPTRFGKTKQITSGDRCLYQLPVTEPFQYTGSDFLTHPYVLGAWLGDGSAGKPCITGAKGDKAIIDRIVSLGYPVSTVCEHQTTGVLTTYFSGDGVADAGLVPKRRGPIPGRMSQELEALGVLRDKHIPDAYKRLTVDLRLQLLAGLIDTDGDADKNGRVTFTTASRRLADDVLELVSGLGFRPYIQEVEPRLSSSGIQGRKPYWRIGFQPTMGIPTVLTRKAVARFAKQRRVGLVSVERVGGGRQGHCIQVDSPDGLYVVGEKLTVTHNSEIGSRHFPAWVLGKHPEWEIIAASHTGSLTLSFSRYIRDLLRDPAYNVVFPDTHLDPSSQSVENWNLMEGGGYLAAGVGTGITGRGCLAPYTLVDTNRGKMRIIDLKVGDSVYGYDHEHKEVVTTRVRAVQVTERSKHLLDFGKIRLTTDHRIYNASRGFYTRAGESPSLLGLRRKEGASCCDLQGVLFEGADGSDHVAQMRLLWEELHAQRCGAPKVTGSTRSGCEGVLRSSLLRHVQNQQPGGVQQGEGRVPALQETCDGNGSFEVLQQGLLQRVQGFETADGCLQWRVSDAKEAGIGARQEVLALRNDKRSVRCASHQSGRDGQPDFESGAALHGVPPQISSVHGTCAADIAKLFESFDFVVDIQTETGNFFTEGLLVHNCHILLLDDLVKDQEAADSPTIRENTWEWYISTAHSRLAPGGGVLGIMCMTGDTPVLMADGSQRRLDSLRRSDEIATYACGVLASSRVAAVKLSGRDLVSKITMRSGKIVRANQRHPFLTVAPSGELSWTRLKDLNTALKIVAVKGSGVNGEALSALPRGATSLPSVADFAKATTRKRSGQTATGPLPQTMSPGATHDSKPDMGSLRPITTQCTSGKAVVAQFVGRVLRVLAHLGTGRASWLSTIATRTAKFAGFCATTATPESDTLLMSQWHLPPQGIYDFTLDEIVSIEPDGEEDVFDVQVDHTENFIANGLVSHNTWWNEDDWAGRIQEAMKGDGEKFEIVRYPAINDEGDEYILPDDSIEQIPPGSPVPEGSVMTRPMNSALHPERYDYKALIKKKLNYIAAGMVRMWNALYQQNPTPDSGIMFTKDLFRRYVHAPSRRGRLIYQAWDFAITEKTTSDWTVCATILQDEYDNLFVLDVFKFKSGDGNAIVEHMIDQYVLWDADYLGMEDGQIWKTMKAQFEKRCRERKVYPSTQILVPLTDKLVRANPLKGRMQLGKVLFPEEGSRPWVDVCVREMIVFPNGKHDDQVDALAWAVRMTLERPPPKDPTPKTKAPESWKKKLQRMLSGQGGGHMAA